MPASIFSYVYGILSAYKITSTFLQRQFGYSHDQLTRVLRQKFSWTSFWQWFVPVLFGSLADGWLIVDDTVMEYSPFRSVGDGTRKAGKEKLSWRRNYLKKQNISGK